nr:marinostatin C1 [Alteromonas sp.]
FATMRYPSDDSE